MHFFGRMGQFFFFIGFLGLVIFYASDQAGDPLYDLLCGSGLLLPFGLFLMWRFRKPASPSRRFNLLRRMRARRLGQHPEDENQHSR